MAYRTSPNINITDAWTALNDGTEVSLSIQLLGFSPVVIAIGSAAPAAANMDGHVIRPTGGKDFLNLTGLTGERVFARVPSGSAASSIAITRG